MSIGKPFGGVGPWLTSGFWLSQSSYSSRTISWRGPYLRLVDRLPASFSSSSSLDPIRDTLIGSVRGKKRSAGCGEEPRKNERPGVASPLRREVRDARHRVISAE